MIAQEILIYIQTVKNFLKTNDEAYQYFTDNGKYLDVFFQKLVVLAKQNFEERGDPQLTVEQFEMIRNTTISKRKSKLYTDFGPYGLFFHN